MINDNLEQDLRNFINNHPDIIIVNDSKDYIDFDIKGIKYNGDAIDDDRWGCYVKSDKEIRLNSLLKFQISTNLLNSMADTNVNELLTVPSGRFNCITITNIDVFKCYYELNKKIITEFELFKRTITNILNLEKINLDFK